jgi:hypothetical protein
MFDITKIKARNDYILASPILWERSQKSALIVVGEEQLRNNWAEVVSVGDTADLVNVGAEVHEKVIVGGTITKSRSPMKVGSFIIYMNAQRLALDPRQKEQIIAIHKNNIILVLDREDAPEALLHAKKDGWNPEEAEDDAPVRIPMPPLKVREEKVTSQGLAEAVAPEEFSGIHAGQVR